MKCFRFLVFALLLVAIPFHAFAAIETATGTISIGTGAIGTNYSVTGVTPATGSWKVVILWWSGRSETTDASGEQDIQPGIGFAVSATSRRAITGQSDHSPTTTAADGYHTDAAVVVLLNIAGAVSALADFVSFNSDGFTLTIDDAFPAALEVSYKLIGGNDLTNAETGQFTLNTATGNFDYTGLTTFQPDFVLFISENIPTAPPSGETSILMSIGAATASAQSVLSVFSQDAVGTSATRSYIFSGEVITTIFTTPITRVSFTNFLSTGWTLNRLEGTAAAYVHYLALKGGSYAIGNFLTATDTTAFTEATGFIEAAKGAMFFSANRAESTQDVATAHAEWSIGAATSGTSRTAQYVRDKNASANADSFSAVEHNEIYVNADNSATQIIEGLGDLNSFDSNGNMTLQMDDADPVASFVWYWTIRNGITFDAVTNSACQTAVSTYSWSHTVGSESDRVLIVGISLMSITTVNSVTYGGTNLTQIRSDTGAATKSELWRLLNPPSGAATVAVILSTSVDSAAGAMSFSGVDQTSPIDAQNGASGTGTPATVNVTTVNNHAWIVDTVVTSDTAITVGANQTQRWNLGCTLGSGAGSNEGQKNPAGAVTMSWDNVGALDTWTISAASLKPSVPVVASKRRAQVVFVD